MSIRRKNNEERCCGNCCWFYGEDTDGWGSCACQKNRDIDMEHCSDMCEDSYISRQEMRHHLAVLLKDIRWDKDTDFIHYSVDGDEATKAKEFAYKYIKTFSKL